MEFEKEPFLKITQSKGEDWVVQTHPNGCHKGYSKIYLRRKKGKSGGFKISGCLPTEEARQRAKQIREQLRKQV
jgi:hypothetical protein